MAVVAGTIKGIHLLSDGDAFNQSGGEETYLVTADFGTYDASADTASLSGVGAAITARKRDGKTRTLRAAHGVAPGVSDTSQSVGNEVYFGAMTVSTDDLTFSLTLVDRSTEVADFATANGVSCVVTCTAA